jgi:hypothetical protein
MATLMRHNLHGYLYREIARVTFDFGRYLNNICGMSCTCVCGGKSLILKDKR